MVRYPACPLGRRHRNNDLEMADVQEQRPIIFIAGHTHRCTIAEPACVRFDGLSLLRGVDFYNRVTDAKFMQDGSSKAY